MPETTPTTPTFFQQIANLFVNKPSLAPPPNPRPREDVNNNLPAHPMSYYNVSSSYAPTTVMPSSYPSDQFQLPGVDRYGRGVPSPMDTRSNTSSPFSSDSSTSVASSVSSTHNTGNRGTKRAAVFVGNVPRNLDLKQLLRTFKNRVPGLEAEIVNEDKIGLIPCAPSNPKVAFFINLKTMEMATQLINTCNGVCGVELSLKEKKKKDKKEKQDKTEKKEKQDKTEKKEKKEKKEKQDKTEKKEKKEDCKQEKDVTNKKKDKIEKQDKVKKEDKPSIPLKTETTTFKLDMEPLHIELLKLVKEKTQNAVGRVFEFSSGSLIIQGKPDESIKTRLFKVLIENTFTKTYFCFMNEKLFNEAKELAAKHKLVFWSDIKSQGKEISCYLAGLKIFEQNLLQVENSLKTRGLHWKESQEGC